MKEKSISSSINIIFIILNNLTDSTSLTIIVKAPGAFNDTVADILARKFLAFLFTVEPGKATPLSPIAVSPLPATVFSDCYRGDFAGNTDNQTTNKVYVNFIRN